MLNQDADIKVKEDVKRFHFSKQTIVVIVRAVQRGSIAMRWRKAPWVIGRGNMIHRHLMPI